ncbi:MAG TPA: TetR family transcriptional regulator [Acidimicrobiales bacterium]|nr:TetR family transcriptional regulator [Acidimicrobiales bacterium]
MFQPEPAAPMGLREKKKAKTRAAIQHAAIRLFREQGYEATTIEQIAEAVEVSPSTLFRYFPSKEDLVLTDEYDPLLIDAYRAQPAGLGPIPAFRNAIRSVLGSLSAEEEADMRGRSELALGVPELRAAQLDQMVQTFRDVNGLIAERLGKEGDDFAARTLTGAIVGVMIAAMFHWVEHPGSDFVELLDEALARLDLGLPV